MGNSSSNESGTEDDAGVSYVGDSNSGETAGTKKSASDVTLDGKKHADADVSKGGEDSSPKAEMVRTKTSRRRSISQAVEAVDNLSRSPRIGNNNPAISRVQTTDNRELRGLQPTVDDNKSKSRGFTDTGNSAPNTNTEGDVSAHQEIGISEVKDETSRKADVDTTKMPICRSISQPMDTTDVDTNKMAIRRVETTDNRGLCRSDSLRENFTAVHEDDTLVADDKSAEETNNTLDRDNVVGPLSTSLLHDITLANEQPLESDSQFQTDEDYLLQEDIFRPILKSFSQVCAGGEINKM